MGANDKRPDPSKDPPARQAPSFFYASQNRSSASASNRRASGGRGSGAGGGRGFGRFALKAALFTGLVCAIIGGGIVGWFVLMLPSSDELIHQARRPSITILAADGSLLATYGDLPGEVLHLTDMPRALPEAVIATEDRRFYSHFGIDPWGLLRAVFTDLRAREAVQGGSTITQQLAKNLYLTSQRSVWRKIHEAVLALWLEQHFTKDQLLELYLNRVYFGAGTYGVDSAAHRYFGKSARDLDIYQCALLAGLLKAPTHFNPANDRKAAADRTSLVLANMVDAGYITPDTARVAASESRHLSSVPSTASGRRYFADWIQDQLTDEKYIGDVTVMTTLDPAMQVAAENAVARNLDKDGPEANVRQAALVAMSPDGAIKAMVGGRDYGTSPFNRATQAQRQPGSAFKLFVYLAALEHGIGVDDEYSDRPLKIGNWQIHDYENKYRGDVTVREAVAQSINTVAVQVEMKTGVSNVIGMAHRLGISGPLQPDLSLALGTADVSLIKLTSAYATLANGGDGLWPYGVISVKDSATGRVLYSHDETGPGRVLEPHIAGTMTQLLEGVIDHGTGRAAVIGRPAAGKTGTTSDFRDALFVGFTPDLVAGVWYGNDDNTPMNHVSGGKLPARTWRDFMRAALAHTPARDFTLPVEPQTPDQAPAEPQQAASTPPDAIGNLLNGMNNGADVPADATEAKGTEYDPNEAPPEPAPPSGQSPLY